MRQFKLLPGFTNVGVATRATLVIPIGVIYYGLQLSLTRNGAPMTTAQMLTDIATLQLKVNDNVIQDWRPDDLIKVNATMGAQFAARDGYLPIWFSRPDRRTMEGEELEGWGTSDIQNFTLEVTFQGAATPTITANAIVDAGGNRPLRAVPIRHIRRLNYAPGAAGQSQLNGLIKGVNIYYARMHFLSSLVTSVKISIDDRIVWHDLPRALVAEIFAEYGLSLQANTYTVAFDLSKQLTDQMATFYPPANNLPAAPVNDLRVDVTVSGAGAFDVLLEQYRFLA